MEQTVQAYYTHMYIEHSMKDCSEDKFFDIRQFMHCDEKVLYYTGLPNFMLLQVVFNFVREYVPGGTALTQFQEFMTTLAKLRLNLGMQDLAYRANISRSTVSRVLHKWLVALDDRLCKACIIWPDRENLQKTMPACFQQSFGKKVAVIIDCFEIFIDRPSGLLARAETWSQYKSHNTVKYLIGITPQGSVSFISSGWGGRVSDKYLTEHSGLFNYIMPGDIVLADRGFTIAENVSLVGAKLAVPAFTKGRDQLTAVGVEESRSMSNVRIHVERVIGCVRQKYTILGGPLHVDFISSKPGEKPQIDRIVRVCCCLHNLCDSVVPFT